MFACGQKKVSETPIVPEKKNLRNKYGVVLDKGTIYTVLYELFTRGPPPTLEAIWPEICCILGQEGTVMEASDRNIDPTTPTGQFEFKIVGLLSEQVQVKRRHSLKKLLGLVEKNIIVDVLQQVNGNQRAAGKILGLKSTTLSAKLKRYGIQVIRRLNIHS